MKIILVILIIMWIYSYYKFKQKMSYFKVVVQCLLEKVNASPNDYQLQLRLASALSEIQQYKDAYDIYNNILKQFTFVPDRDTIMVNMEFCKCPIPGSSLKNHNNSWLHNFLLVRLGRRRANFLIDEDLLSANSRLRNQ